MLFGKRKRVVKRILIVEDEPLTAFDNEIMLGDAGYEVVATLDDFDEAIALLDREQVDLILSDVRLREQADRHRPGPRGQGARRPDAVRDRPSTCPRTRRRCAIGCLTQAL